MMSVALAAASIAILTASGYLCLLVDTLAHGRFPRPRQRTALVAAIVVSTAVQIVHDARPELVPAVVAGVCAVFPVAVAIALALMKRGRVRLADIGQRTLVGSQTFRIVGLAWFAYGLYGFISPVTAVALGVVETALGVSAPFVAGIQRDRPYRWAAIAAWNAVGFIAGISAITLAHQPAAFPLGVLTLFVEPLALALHVLSFAALVHRRTVAYLRGA